MTFAAILEQIAKILPRQAPFVSALFALVLSFLLGHSTWAALLGTALVLTPLHYWSLHRPDLWHTGHAFVFGLLLDFLAGLPIGLSALLFTLWHQSVLWQRPLLSGSAFITQWAGFAVLALIFCLLRHFVLVYFEPGRSFFLLTPWMEALSASACYPVFTSVFSALNKRLEYDPD